jgi:hypothetical protein
MNVRSGPESPPQHDADRKPSVTIGRALTVYPDGRQRFSVTAFQRDPIPLETFRRQVRLANRLSRLLVEQVSQPSQAMPPPAPRARSPRPRHRAARGDRKTASDDPDPDPLGAPPRIRAVAAEAGMDAIGDLVAVELERLRRLAA